MLICRHIFVRVKASFNHTRGIVPLFVLCICLIAHNLCGAAPQTTAQMVLLDSAEGETFIKRSGTTTWKPAASGDTLRNNDMLQIKHGNTARCLWPDTSCAYINGDARVLFNFTAPGQKSMISGSVTIYSGELFLTVHRPTVRVAQKEFKLYTPCAAISINDGSAALKVDGRSGLSDVQIIAGSAVVRNTTLNSNMFLKAPFGITVRRDQAASTAVALTDGRIDSLCQWVPQQVLDKVRADHLSNQRRNRIIISGRLEQKFTVMQFSSATKAKGTNHQRDIGSAISRMLVTRLNREDNRINIISADPKVSTPDSAGTRFVLHGTVTTFDIINLAQISIGADEYRELSSGRVGFDLSLYDTLPGEDVFSATVLGEHAGKKSAANSWNTIDTLPFDLENEQFATSIIGLALTQALEDAVAKIMDYLYQ